MASRERSRKRTISCRCSGSSPAFEGWIGGESVTITLSPPIYPSKSGDDPEHLQEIVRLRDLSREAIARHSGEPLL